jgi:hypothetical protein
VDPVLQAHVTDAWVDAQRAYETALVEYESRRRLVQRRRQEESNRAQSIFVSGIDLILGALQSQLTRLLEQSAPIVAELDGATTAEQAIEADAGAAWKQLTGLAGEYQSLRAAQTFVMMRGPYHLWKSCTPAVAGDDHANLCFLKNVADLWPDWQQPGMATQRINLSDRSTPRRAEPWPTDEYSPEMLVWLHTSDADPWLPTTKQLRELWTAPTNTSDNEPHESDAGAEYKSLMAGPSFKPPPSSHRGRPVTEAERASRAAEFAQLQGEPAT